MMPIIDDTNTDLSWEQRDLPACRPEVGEKLAGDVPPRMHQSGRIWGWRGLRIRCRSQSAAHPRIPISHPLCRPPSLLPVRANRRRCGAAVAHLSCVIVSPSVPPSPLSRPPLPSHPKFTMFFAALSSPFPGRLCTYPTILSSRLWAGRRRRGINERIIGYRG